MAETGRKVGTLAIGGISALVLYKYLLSKFRGYVDVQVYETVVQDSQKTYSPLPDAEVEVDGVKGTTDASGKVSLEVSSGRRYVYVRKEGYLTACDEVEVPAMGRVSKTFYLVKQGQSPPAGEQQVTVVATGDVSFGSDTWSESYSLSPQALVAWLPWWAGGSAWYFKKFTRDWVEKGTALTDTPTPHWPFVPLTLRRYIPVRMPVGKVTVTLRGTTPTGEVYTKSAATLDSGKANLGFVPEGEYTLEVSYGDNRDLEYILDGVKGKSQRITVDKDHTVFEVHLPYPELFPKRSARIDYMSEPAYYFLRVVEQPVPCGANLVLVWHKNPDMMNWYGGGVFLEAWEADEPGVLSPYDPKAKLVYEVHNIIVGKSSDLKQLVEKESWLKPMVEEWVFGAEWEAYCIKCGRRVGYGDDILTGMMAGICHYIEEAELGHVGMRAGTACLITTFTDWTTMFDWFKKNLGMPPHLFGMVVPRGEHKYLYLRVSKAEAGTILCVEQGATVFIEEEKRLLIYMPRPGYHPRTWWKEAREVVLQVECPLCGFKTSERSVTWPLDYRQVMLLKDEAWKEFLSDAHLSKHPGLEFEEPETRLRQVLLWGWGVPPESTFGMLPQVSVSSALGSMTSSLGVPLEVSVSSSLGAMTNSIGISPIVSVSSSLGAMTNSIGISPIVSVSSTLSPTTSSLGLSPSITVSSSLTKTTQTIALFPSTTVSSSLSKSTA
jgi:hypothetical protein